MTRRFFMVDFPKEAPVTGSTEIHRGTPMMAQWDVKDNAVWFEITPLEESVVCRIDGDTLRKYFGRILGRSFRNAGVYVTQPGD
jgi:hypothetical protein